MQDHADVGACHAGEIALLKLRLQIPPRYFIDMLSCVRVDQTWQIVQKVTNVESR